MAPGVRGTLRSGGLGLLAFAAFVLLLRVSGSAFLIRQPWAWGRGVTFLMVGAALVAAGLLLRRLEAVPDSARMAVWIAAGLLPLWYVTLEIVIAVDGRTNGRLAGNQAMWIAAAWGLYGLLLALAEWRFRSRPLRAGALFVLAAALGFLAVAALPGNARWAEKPVRLVAYAGVFGSIWLMEALYRRHDPGEETNGLLATAAAVAAAYALSFEVDRYLEPLFTLPAGQFITAAQLSWQQSTAVFTRLTVWGGYGLLLVLAGRYLRSVTVKRVAAGVLGVALVYGLLFALPNRLAPPGLQLTALVVVAAGNLMAVRGLLK